MTQAGRFRHRPSAPVRGPARRCFQGADNHGFHVVIGDGPRRARARFVQQPVHAPGDKPRAPAPTICGETRSRLATAWLSRPRAHANTRRARRASGVHLRGDSLDDVVP